MSAYELRIYKVAEGRMPILRNIFQELVLPMLSEYTIESVGYWTTPNSRTLYYIVRHESLDAIVGNWDRFHADPRWKPGLAAREQGEAVVEATQSVSLLSMEGLPPARAGADDLA